VLLIACVARHCFRIEPVPVVWQLRPSEFTPAAVFFFLIEPCYDDRCKENLASFHLGGNPALQFAPAGRQSGSFQNVSGRWIVIQRKQKCKAIWGRAETMLKTSEPELNSLKRRGFWALVTFSLLTRWGLLDDLVWGAFSKALSHTCHS